MSTLVYGVISGVLIASGGAMIVRDMRAKQRRAEGLGAQRPAHKPTENVVARAAALPETAVSAAVTIVRRDDKITTETDVSRPRQSASTQVGPGLARLRADVARVRAEADEGEASPGENAQRWPTVEVRWVALDPVVDRAVGALNKELASILVRIEPRGEASWSFRNRGFGAYRRVAVGEASVAWLRCELNASGVLSFKVRAHTKEHAVVNATAEVIADGVTEAALIEALAQCLAPIARFAAWVVPKAEPAVPQLPAPPQWTAVAGTVNQAIGMAHTALGTSNGGLKPAGGAGWDAETNRWRWPMQVLAGGAPVATLHVDLTETSLEVASEPHDATRAGVARRRRIESKTVVPSALAEVLASCAWPAIADAHEGRERAQLKDAS